MEITKELLIHWWHYYGKLIYSFDELEEFISLIDEKGVDTIFNVATASYICDDGSPTILLTSMREGKIEELLKTLEWCTDETTSKEAIETFNQVRFELFNIISSTFN